MMGAMMMACCFLTAFVNDAVVFHPRNDLISWEICAITTKKLILSKVKMELIRWQAGIVTAG